MRTLKMLVVAALAANMHAARGEAYQSLKNVSDERIVPIGVAGSLSAPFAPFGPIFTPRECTI